MGVWGQWNPVNTDTKGTGQIVRINRVSVLSSISEKKSRIHVDLLEQSIDVDNNSAIWTEAVGDSGKQRTSKRKKTTSDGCSKRQRKWNFQIGTAVRKGSNTGSHAIKLLFVIKSNSVIIWPGSNVFKLANNRDSENWECTDKQCP